MRPRPAALVVPAALAAVLALGGCGERDEQTSFQHVSHHESTADSALGIDTGVGGRSAKERGTTDPLRYAFYGLPQRGALASPDLVLYNDGYVVGYDVAHKLPAWACYRLFAGGKPSGKESKATSGADPRLPAGSDPYSQVMSDKKARESAQFTALVPAAPLAACYGDAAGAQTLLSSDLVRGGDLIAFNQLTGLEASYAQAYGEVWVACGPLVGENGAIGGLWKIQVTVQDGKTRAQAFALPLGGDKNAHSVDLALYLTTVTELEKRTGLRFFADFHDTWEDTRELIVTAHPEALWATGSASVASDH
jgi:hypothetical protein